MTPAAARPLRSSSGFTLIEILITLAVIAILAAIAYPSFIAQIRKSRRTDATTALARIQMAQEKFRSNNTSYGILADLGVPAASTDGYYTLAVSGNSATGYTATATPVAGKSQAADSVCPTITVTVAAGNATYGPVAGCWGK